MKTRSLITIGIFNALLLVLLGIGGMISALFPPLFIILPIIFGLIGGPVFMYMIAKCEIRGIFAISGIIIGVCMLTMAPYGSMGISIILGGVFGEIAYGIAGSGKYVSAVIGYCLYILGYAFGEIFPFVFFTEAYIAQEAEKGGSTLHVVKACVEMLNVPLLAVICILSIGAAILGSFWGKKLLRKHFEKAGLV